MSTPGNALNITSSGLVKFATPATFSAVTVTEHDVLVGGASNGITSVAPSATAGVPLVSGGSSADPSFTTAVVAGGGTGRTTLTNHGVLVGAATTAITQLAAGSAGQVLQSGGASADPAYSTATFPATATSTGTILRADGTNWVATTATYPATTTANDILYSSATNVIGQIATANSGILQTDGSGVPSFATSGSWTPAIQFGGSSTGVTYTTQTGGYIQIGNLVFVYFNITLSSKGAQTGNARISGLPVTVGGTQIAFAVTSFSNITLTASYTTTSCTFNNGTTTIQVQQAGSAQALASITNSGFANTSAINGSGFYFA